MKKLLTFKEIFLQCKDTLNENLYSFFNKEHLMEMSNIRKKRTKLPVNIWIDDSRTYIRGKHGKRIKFQITKSEKFDHTKLASMDLDGNVYNLPKNAEVDFKDIKEIQNFVANNRIIIDKIADMDIDFSDFMDLMFPGGKLLGDEIKQVQIEGLQKLLNKEND